MVKKDDTTDFTPIRSSICKEKDCTKRPSFNIESETKALYCFEHKKEGMIDVTRKTCIYKGCKTRPIL